MKVYQCDSCERTITDPYEAKMKEFYLGSYDVIYPVKMKQKVKVHLCDDCYKGLRFIAERQRSNKNV